MEAHPWSALHVTQRSDQPSRGPTGYASCAAAAGACPLPAASLALPAHLSSRHHLPHTHDRKHADRHLDAARAALERDGQAVVSGSTRPARHVRRAARCDAHLHASLARAAASHTRARQSAGPRSCVPRCVSAAPRKLTACAQLAGVISALHNAAHALSYSHSPQSDKIAEASVIIERLSKLKHDMGRDHKLEPIPDDGGASPAGYNDVLQQEGWTWFNAPCEWLQRPQGGAQLTQRTQGSLPSATSTACCAPSLRSRSTGRRKSRRASPLIVAQLTRNWQLRSLLLAEALGLPLLWLGHQPARHDCRRARAQGRSCRLERWTGGDERRWLARECAPPSGLE